MSTPYDVAFGRLAIERGLLTREQVQQVHAQLPPGQGLAEVLVGSGVLRPEHAQRLQRELSQSGDSATTLAAPSDPSRSSSSSIGGLPQVGDRIGGRYEVLDTLGKGGMGAVFRARDLQLNLEVAVKVLLPGADAAGTAVERFEREAQAMSKVDRHAGIVRIRDAGVHGSSPYAVLDLVLGGDLRTRVKDDGPLPVEEAAQLTERVARAIAHCHAQGILHRDLKPANVLVQAEDGQPFLTDFGLVRDAEAERLTKTGQVLGTPSYMSPEQADGDWHAIDERTDVYGLGAILYELLVGEPPFRGEGMQVLKQVLLDPPVPPAERRPEVPADLSAICCKALAKDQDVRYPTADALADDLAAFGRGDPLTIRAPGRREHFRWAWRRRQPWAVGTVAGVTLLVIAAFAAGGLGTLVWVRAQQQIARVAALRAHADAITASLEGEDPLLLERRAVDRAAEALKQAIALCTAVQSEAAPVEKGALVSDDMDALTAMLEQRGHVRQALDDRQITGIQGVMRRYAVQAGWPAPWQEVGRAGEDHLFMALKYLGWRRDAHVSVELVERGEEELALATSPPVVQAAAESVRQRLSATRAALAAYLDEGAGGRLLWDSRTWSHRKASLERLLDDEKNLRSAARGGLGRRAAGAAMQRLSKRLVSLEAGAFSSPLLYQQTRKWYRERVLPLVGETANLKIGAAGLLRSLAKQAKAASVSLDGLRSIMTLAHTLADQVDWSDPTFVRPMVDLAIVHIEEAIPGRKALDPGLLELMPRFGFLVAQGNIRPVVRRTLPVLITHAKEVNRGDAWLNVAAATEEVGKDEGEDLRRCMALYARALGERLSGEERSRLLKSANQEPLARPLTPMWEPFVRYRIAVIVVKLASSASTPDLEWLKAGADEVQRLWRAGAGKMPRDALRMSFLRHGAQSLQAAIEHQPAWKATYEADARAMIEAGEQVAWGFLQEAITGGKEQKDSGSLFDADHSLDPDKNEYDWVNQSKRLLSFYWEASADDAIRRYDALQAKLKALRGRINLGFELHALIRYVHFGGEQGVKRAQERLPALQAEAARRWKKAPTEQGQKKAAGLMDEAVVLQIRTALAVGDLDGALGLYREVIDRKGGEHRWWPNFIVPVLCKHLVAAKRRETLVELLERLRRAKGGTKESQDLFRIALGR